MLDPSPSQVISTGKDWSAGTGHKGGAAKRVRVEEELWEGVHRGLLEITKQSC